MQFQKEVTKEKNAKISIQVTVDRDSVGKAHESIIREFEQNAKLPGFRKGKVPRSVILSHFKDSIKNETIGKVLSDSLSQILKETEYKLISQPSVTEMGDLVADESFSFTAECDIMPEVKVPTYKGVSSEKYIYDVKEAAVKQEIEQLREQFANLVTVDRKAKLGDYIVIDYTEEAEGEKQGEQKENQTVFLDKKDDQLAQQLIGLGNGDSKDIELEHEYEEEGEKKTYKVNVHVDVKEIKQKELPEPNDDFAKDISDVENFAELKKAIRDDLKEQAARLSEERSKDELMKKIIEKAEYDIPETLISHEIDRMLADVAHNYRIDLDKLKEDEKRYKEYRDTLRPRAQESLKYELLLAEIAKKEEIKVTEEEMDKEIKEYAERQKRNFEDMKKKMKDNDTLDSLRYRMRIAKTLNFVYENAKLDQEKHLNFGAEKENV
jgi:trigger factor